jgi:hypothetical protein
MKLAGFPPISPLFPDLQGISRPETRSPGTACTATQSALCGSYTAPQKIHDILQAALR